MSLLCCHNSFVSYYDVAVCNRRQRWRRSTLKFAYSTDIIFQNRNFTTNTNVHFMGHFVYFLSVSFTLCTFSDENRPYFEAHRNGDGNLNRMALNKSNAQTQFTSHHHAILLYCYIVSLFLIATMLLMLMVISTVHDATTIAQNHHCFYGNRRMNARHSRGAKWKRRKKNRATQRKIKHQTME